MLKTLKYYLFLFVLLLTFIQLNAKASAVDSLKIQLESLEGDQRIECLLAIAMEISTEDPSASIKFANEALELSQISNNIVLQARCRKNLGDFFYQQGRYSKAHICFKKTLAVLKKENSKREFSEIYIKIGQIYSREGVLDSAAMYFEQAFVWAKKNQDTIYQIKSLRSIGNTFYKKGQFDEALKNYTKALAVSSWVVPRDIEVANLYNNLGVLFSDWAKYPQSLSYYLKSLAIEDSLGNDKKIVRLYNNIGTIYWYQNQPDSALVYYLKSLKGREKYGDINGKAYVLNNLGMYYGSKGETKKSLDYFNESLKSFEAMSNRSGIVMALYNIGSVYQMEENYNLAKKYFSQSLSIAKNQNFSDYIVSNYEALKEIYSELGDWERAYQTLEIYKTINDSIRDKQNIELLSEIEVKFEKEKKQAELQILKNQMHATELNKDKTLITITGFIVILFLIIISTYILIRQIRMRADIKYNELNPALLRYKLNPQFINSSLSGIKELIAKSRVQESSVFLAGLAKLIRVFVETSASNVIVLEKELDTLQSFLKLHQLRYDHQLTFELNIASHVETEMLAIPPFLFFPTYVHIIDNHLNKGAINTVIDIDTQENYLIIKTDFTYFIDKDTIETDEIDMSHKVDKVIERVGLLNDTFKDKMHFSYKANVNDISLIKTVSLQLKLPIKPM